MKGAYSDEEENLEDDVHDIVSGVLKHTNDKLNTDYLSHNKGESSDKEDLMRCDDLENDDDDYDDGETYDVPNTTSAKTVLFDSEVKASTHDLNVGEDVPLDDEWAMIEELLSSENTTVDEITDDIRYHTKISEPWLDENCNKRISVIIEVASGIGMDDCRTSLEQEGEVLVYHEKRPDLLLSSGFILDQSNIDQSHVKARAFHHVIKAKREDIDAGKKDQVEDKQRIRLPFPCEYAPPTYTKRGEKIPNVDFYGHNHSDPGMRKKKQKIFLLHIELIALEKVLETDHGYDIATRGD